MTIDHDDSHQQTQQKGKGYVDFHFSSRWNSLMLVTWWSLMVARRPTLNPPKQALGPSRSMVDVARLTTNLVLDFFGLSGPGRYMLTQRL
jgi:hypothetical protein